MAAQTHTDGRNQEQLDFLHEIEETVSLLQLALESPTADARDTLEQAELLLSAFVACEGLLQQEDNEFIFEALVCIALDAQKHADESRRQHMRAGGKL
jgi:hypothetical protein